MARKYGDELDTDNDQDLDLVFTADDEEQPRGLRVGTAQLAGVSPVRVRNPFQVVYDQVVYKPGDEVTVPSHIAADWLRDGWVEPAE